MWTNKAPRFAVSMRLSRSLSLCVFLSASGPASLALAQEKETEDRAVARAAIDRAIKAHGGAENLSKFKAVSAKFTGKRKVENMFFWDSINVLHFQAPNKIRIDSEVHNPGGTKFDVYRLVNGNKGWQGAGTRYRELKEPEVAQILDDAYAFWLASLMPFNDKNDKSFDFATVGEVDVDNKAAFGIRVLRKGQPDVNLYFDKKTNLVVKSERRSKDPQVAQEFTAESFFRDHKEFDGVLWATKRIDKRDGMDLDGDSGKFELSEIRGHDSVDEKLFARP